MKKSILLTIILVQAISGAIAQTQWTQTSTPPGGSVWDIEVIGTNIFAATSSGGIYFSSDNGTTWVKRNGAFPNMEVRSLVVSGSDIFAGTSGSFGGGVYKSSDNGANWTNVTPVGMNTSTIVSAMVVTGTDIYIGNWQDGVFKSSLSGISTTSWTPFNTNLTNKSIRSLKIKGTTIYAGTYGNGVWTSPTSTAAWSLTSSTMPEYSDNIQSLNVSGSTIFAGNISGTPVLYRSTDNGANWIQSNTSIFADKPVYEIINDGNTVYTGTEGAGIYKSTDNGVTWSAYNEGLQDTSGNWICANIRSLVFSGNYFFAGTDGGVWRRSATPLSINESATNDQVTFYPNPSKENIVIKVENISPAAVYTIYDQLGRVVLTGKITNETSSINIHELNTGMYILSMETMNPQRFRFIKE